MSTTKITSASGLRRIDVYLLGSTGYPDGDQSGANGYDGEYLSGASSISVTVPDVQPIQHVGDDNVFAQDFLPANSGVTATVNTAKTNLNFDATITGTRVEDVGDGEIGGLATSAQGSELDVCVIYTRQAVDTDPSAGTSFNKRRWQVGIFPKGRMIPKGASPEQGGADQNVYNVVPTSALAAPWGKPFTQNDNGFTRAQWLRGSYEYPPRLERHTGNNTLDTFNLTWTPISVAKTKVFVDGTPATVSSVDVENKTYTLNSAPANNAIVVAWYETTDDIS